MPSRRILVVDDSPTFLAGAVALIEAAEGIEVVGTADSGRLALERAAELEPDLVLVDLSMPEINGLEVARRLARRADRPRVVIMTAHAEKAYRAAALRAGADGFLRKEELELRLIPLIETLLSQRDGDEHANGK